jgi:cytochrome c oxidase assembly protein subunit 15
MKYSKAVKIWLIIGLVMVFLQVIIGGITRLTESGLSITEWNVISGTIPPLNNQDWNNEFELYKNTPQYAEVFEGIELSDFKFIYFWEFIHRFWARIMGLVFLFPFLYFLWKKQIDKSLSIKLGYVILLAILAATFGWIMVASGLIDRPWVNAYKLSVHLCIAFAVYTALFYCYKHVSNNGCTSDEVRIGRSLLNLLMIIIWIQIFFGGIMSGMRAGVIFPTWPLIGNSFFPPEVFNISNWSVSNFINYDENTFLPSLIHFLHRMTAYIVFITGIYIVFKEFKRVNSILKSNLIVFAILLVSQVILGIITVLMCKGEVPILWGTLHQAFALLLLTAFLNLYYNNNVESKENLNN